MESGRDADGVGLEFHHELDDVLDDFLVAENFDGAIIFAGGESLRILPPEHRKHRFGLQIEMQPGGSYIGTIWDNAFDTTPPYAISQP